MMKKSEGKPRRLSVKKQAVKTGREGAKRKPTGPIEVVVRGRPGPGWSDLDRSRTRAVARERKRQRGKEGPSKPD